MKIYTRHIFLLFFLSSLLAIPVMGDAVGAAKDRMKDRLEQVDRLKAEGSVGENYNGYLSALSSLQARLASLVKAENADRQVIYTSVAETTGQSVEEVGKQRAVRIAELARPGVWLQKPNGEWVQKP